MWNTFSLTISLPLFSHTHTHWQNLRDVIVLDESGRDVHSSLNDIKVPMLNEHTKEFAEYGSCDGLIDRIGFV